jgi:hypothetical protein
VVDLGVEQRNVKEGGYALDVPHSEEAPVAMVNTVWNLPVPEDGGNFIVS